VLETTMADGPLERTVLSAAARARDAGEHLLEHNTRVLVVKHIEDDERELEALLAHEIAHAITVPIWQPNNNHPPAFVEFETLTSHALAGTLVSHKTDARRTDAKNEAKNNEAKKTDVRRTEAKKKEALTAGPSAPSLPRSKPPRVSSSLRAGTRRSR
jgi:predicted SprT family Zn-dependent metalloprotease